MLDDKERERSSALNSFDIFDMLCFAPHKKMQLIKLKWNALDGICNQKSENAQR